MTKAYGQHTAAQSKKQYPSVSSHFADASAQKIIWANLRLNDKASGRHRKAAREAEQRIILTNAANPAEILMKLALLADWIEPDVTPTAMALLQSIIKDLDGPADIAPLPATQPELKTTAKPAAGRTRDDIRKRMSELGTFGAPVETPPVKIPSVVIDRRARPCVVNGALFPSVISAARALNMSVSEINRLAA